VDAAFAFRLSTVNLQNGQTVYDRVLARGDNKGSLAIFTIPEMEDKKIDVLKQENFDRKPGRF